MFGRLCMAVVSWRGPGWGLGSWCVLESMGVSTPEKVCRWDCMPVTGLGTSWQGDADEYTACWWLKGSGVCRPQTCSWHLREPVCDRWYRGRQRGMALTLKHPQSLPCIQLLILHTLGGGLPQARQATSIEKGRNDPVPSPKNAWSWQERQACKDTEVKRGEDRKPLDIPAEDKATYLRAEWILETSKAKEKMVTPRFRVKRIT